MSTDDVNDESRTKINDIEFEYHRLAGFSGDPFSPDALKRSEFGRKALVGREETLNELNASLNRGSKIITLQGNFGVGKTSLINCSAYDIYMATFNTDRFKRFVQCDNILEIGVDDTADEFRKTALKEVARTLVKYSSEIDVLSEFGKEIGTLRRWIEAPDESLIDWQVSVFGVTVGKSASPKSNEEFNAHGVYNLIEFLLEKFFPDANKGGLICVIENAEKMETNENIRDVVESLRDRLFTLPGLRWILTGGSQMFIGLYSSRRLSRYMSEPIQISALSKKDAEKAFDTRVKLYSRDGIENLLPISSGEFGQIYDLLGRNLGDAFTMADNFVRASFSKAHDSKKLFEGSLNQYLSEKVASVRSNCGALSPVESSVFDCIAANGSCTQAELARILSSEFNSSETGRAIVRLESSGLIGRSRTPHISSDYDCYVTNNGWIYRLDRSAPIL